MPWGRPLVERSCGKAGLLMLFAATFVSPDALRFRGLQSRGDQSSSQPANQIWGHPMYSHVP